MTTKGARTVAMNTDDFESGAARTLRLSWEEFKKRRGPITRLADLARERAATTGVTIGQARATVLRENPDLRRQVQEATYDGD
jgi:hypothetical protein